MDNKIPVALEQKLNSLDCPFKWVKDLTTGDLKDETSNLHEKVKEKLNESNDDDFIEFGFPNGICLIYESIKKKEVPETIREIIEVCEAKLKSVFENRKNHSLILKARLAFLHILQSCKAHFEFQYGNTSSLQDVINSIPDNNTFNADIQACVNGIKAAFLLVYGPYNTTKIGIKCAKQAVELDKSEGWYYFLVGKGLYRHRRAVNRDLSPTEEEINFMERARQLEFNYRETEMFLVEMYSEMIQKGNHRENYLNKTVQLCRRIYENVEDWYCLWRCCRGLLRIHNNDLNLTLVHKCLEKANRLSPNNPEILFTLCHFYEIKRDLQKALYYVQLAITHGEVMPMFVSTSTKLMHRINRSQDLTPAFDEYISRAQMAFNRHVCMCLKARYLLQEKQGVMKVVLDIFAQILQEDPHCCLQAPKRDIELYNLVAVLFPEIQAGVGVQTRTTDERDYCESKLAELKQMYPALLKLRPLGQLPEMERLKQWWNTYYNL